MGYIIHVTSIVGVIILGVLVALGGTAPALGAQMHAVVDPNADSSSFDIRYQRTVFIEYHEDSSISDLLHGKAWTLDGTADSSDPAVQKLVADLNQNILSDRSIAAVEDVTVDYKITMTGRDGNTSFDFEVLLKGSIVNYVIIQDQLRSLVDMGWRAISSSESVVIDNVDINIPLNMLQTTEPEIYQLVANTEADEILSIPVMDADYILEQPMNNWHRLQDVTGISADALRFGLSDELSGKVFHVWTMGESNLQQGRQVEREWKATVSDNTHPTLDGDISYDIRAVQNADISSLTFVGYATVDELDGVEVMGITPRPPEGISETSTGNFPVIIIYGMAGMAAVGGGIFFMFSNRSLKNEKEGQQGIDPSRLVGYQTSAASGGYQTNRGEAQLRDQSEYQQTRSYYDQLDTFKSTKGSEITPPASPTPSEAACPCAAFTDSNMECDCQMQASCLCDATCSCLGDVCTNHVSMM